jgi:protein-tyrosine phosphatase
MIDIHCHILPGIDDGALDFEKSIEMAFIAAEDGIKTIVATPHVNSPSLTPETIASLTNKLNEKLVELKIPVNIVTGGEIVYGLPVDMKKKYSINNNGFILLEFPHSHMPINSKSVIEKLKLEGYRSIIAHPERNPTIIRNPEVLIDIVESTNAIAQITADSIIGTFGRRIRNCARYLLKKNAVKIIASDAHS